MSDRPGTSSGGSKDIEPSLGDLKEESEALKEQLVSATRTISDDVAHDLLSDSCSMTTLVERYLKRFYATVQEISGVDVEKILGSPEFMEEDEEDEMADGSFFPEEKERLHPEKELVEYRDIYKNDLIDMTASIEDLIKSPEFVACLETFGEDNSYMTPSLESLINKLNESIAICSKPEKQIHEENQVEEELALDKDPEEIAGDTNDDILKSADFENFFQAVVDISRTEMKDIFAGDDDLVNTEDFKEFCLEIFKKTKNGPLETFDEDTGPKFVLEPVKASLDDLPASEEECNKLWRSFNVKSYYDCVYSNLQENGQVEPLHRLTLIGKLDPDNRTKVEKEYENLYNWEAKQVFDKASVPGGILVIFKNFFFHVVEGSGDGFESTIQFAVQHIKCGWFIGCKVVETVFDIPNRHFDYWKSVYIRREELPLAATNLKFNDVTRHYKLRELREKITLYASFTQNVPKDEFVRKFRHLMPLNVLPEEEYEKPLHKKFDVCI